MKQLRNGPGDRGVGHDNASFSLPIADATFQSLSAQSFNAAVIDMDESGLSAAQVHALQDQGKVLFTYLSVGEAEDYRDYWIDGNWSTQKPSFVLGEIRTGKATSR